MKPQYQKSEKILLKNHPDFNEKWVQTTIANDPSILGLGDIILKDKERIQPHAGRLDLLFQDPDTNLRYEVEVQLGQTDESHIIRTIEYWDIERKRYPQYDHVAVIVAEDITSRFLNVINLFNGMIPLIALQMSAIKFGDNITLIFTKVLDQRTLGRVEEEEEQESVDRSYWENRGTKVTVKMADKLLELIHQFDPEFQLKYNKFYIGLAKNEQPLNFVVFRPQKRALRLELKLERSEELDAKFEEAEFDILDYNVRNGRYRLRLTKDDIEKHRDFLVELFEKAYNNFGM